MMTCGFEYQYYCLPAVSSGESYLTSLNQSFLSGINEITQQNSQTIDQHPLLLIYYGYDGDYGINLVKEYLNNFGSNKQTVAA